MQLGFTAFALSETMFLGSSVVGVRVFLGVAGEVLVLSFRTPPVLFPAGLIGSSVPLY